MGGVASRAELLNAGASRGAIDAACRSGAIERIARGLFMVAGADRTDTRFRQRCALALLGPDAALTHVTAAAHYGTREVRPGESVHVMVPHGRGHRRMPGIAVHQTRMFEPIAWQGWPIAPPRQALIHVATENKPELLRFPALAAVQLGLLGPSELADAQGVPRRCLNTWNLVAEEALAGAESGGEGRYWRLLKDAGLPLPELNVSLDTPAGRYRLDALWRERRLVAEIDGRRHHTMEQDFERDRVRQNHIHACGLVVIRFTVNQVLTEPDQVLAVTAQNLFRRPAGSRWVAVDVMRERSRSRSTTR